MIRKLEVQNFKRFRDATFELDDQLVIVGPNNCGKTTLLQAIALWAEAWRHWTQDEGASAWLRSSGPEVRTSRDRYVKTTLAAIQSVAVTDFAHLWHDQNVGEPIVLAMHAQKWSVRLELHFETSGTIAVRPADAVCGHDLQACDRASLAVVYVPSTLRIEETESLFEEEVLRDRLSRGRGASVLRNMLLRLSESDDKWSDLKNETQALFGYELRLPSRGEPLSVSYRHSDDDDWLEIACAGSGFLQFLLLSSSLLYAGPHVALIDEPDMHLHRLLQQEVYNRLPKLWGSQFIVSSHSDVLVDVAEADHLRSVTTAGLVQVKDASLMGALRLLTNSDVHTALAIERILYVEGKTDVPILRAWAKATGHPAASFLERPFCRPTSQEEKGFASKHLVALRTMAPSCRGIELRDSNRRNMTEENGGKPRTPATIYWRRYEIENYLLHPEAILRFVEKRGTGDMKKRAEGHIRKNWPPALLSDPFAENLLDRTKGKDVIAKLMHDVGLDWKHTNCVDIAEEMKRHEVHDEVRDKLDRIAEELNLTAS